jgi:hypothetical protein
MQEVVSNPVMVEIIDYEQLMMIVISKIDIRGRFFFADPAKPEEVRAP